MCQSWQWKDSIWGLSPFKYQRLVRLNISQVRIFSIPPTPNPVQKLLSLSFRSFVRSIKRCPHLEKLVSRPISESVQLATLTTLAKRIRSGAGSLSFICRVSPWCCAFNSLSVVEWVNCRNLIIIRTSPLERMRLQLPPFTRLKLARYRGSIRRK